MLLTYEFLILCIVLCIMNFSYFFIGLHSCNLRTILRRELYLGKHNFKNTT